MRAPTWHSKGDIRREGVPDPTTEHERDPIIKTTGCAMANVTPARTLAEREFGSVLR